jgi:hypothetical protein
MLKKNKSMKTRAKLGLATKSIPAKIELSNTIELKMTGNEKFPSPKPPLLEVKTATDELEKAYSLAQTGGKQQTAEMYQKEAVLDNLLTLLAGYVEGVADGNDAIILSAGMDVQSERTPAQLPDPPENLKVVNGAIENSLMLSWDNAKFAKVYQIEQNSNDLLPENEWQIIAVQTKRKLEVTDLVSGKKYGFRIKAVGVKGTGGATNPVVQRVL